MAPSPEPREPPTSQADASLVASAWKGLELDLDRERGPAGRLRRLTTGARLAVALGAALAPPVLVALLARRDDLEGASASRALAWLATLAPLALLGASVAVRPLEARSLEARQVLGLALASMLAAGALVLLPLGGVVPDPHGHGPLVCATVSLVVGAAVFLAVRALRRDAIGASVGAGVLAACAAFAAAALACPMDALAHLGPGHAAPIVVIVGAALAWDRRAPGARA